MTSYSPSRREFLAGSSIFVVGLSLGSNGEVLAQSVMMASSPLAQGAKPVDPERLDSWLAIDRGGNVTAYTGRIDMGTGTETVYAQFVADELDVAIEKVHVVMGDTQTTPYQGKSTASLNVMLGSQPLRVAAAQARATLVGVASKKLGVPADDLEVVNGVIKSKSKPSLSVSYGELIDDKTLAVELEAKSKDPDDLVKGITLKEKAPFKARSDYKFVGKSIPRIELPAKVAGTFEYVHNVRVDGMLHGRVVRPPAFGATLVSVSEDSIKGIPGVQLVRQNNFLGVVAPREEDAVKAAARLKATWQTTETLPEFGSIYEQLSKQKVVGEGRVRGFGKGDYEAGLQKGAFKHKASYTYAFQDHGMIGPSCAIADVKPDGATIWSGTQWPDGDRSDIAKMLGLPVESVRLVWKEASGAYGRLGCDDAAADAAIMSKAVGKPVRVQWMREDEHGWEPVSPAMMMTVEGAVDKEGKVTAFDYLQYSPSHSSGERGAYPGWILMGGAPGSKRMSGGGANIWYDLEASRGRNVFVEAWLRGIFLRSPGGIQSIFAYESFMTELAALAGIDPLEMRLRNTKDARDRAVLEKVAQMSDWKAARQKTGSGSTATGRGLAMARYGAGESRSALVVDITIDKASGRIAVDRAFMAFDCGFVVNPDGAMNQVEGGLLQGLSRTLHEEVKFDKKMVTTLNWADYPILTFSEVPDVRIELIPRPDLPWASTGEAGTVATSAAVASAVFDAIGKYPRRIPLAPEYIKTLV